MEVLLLSLVQDHPLFASALLVIGGLRIIFKPLMPALQKLVLYTPPDGDDKLLAKVMASPYYKGLVWLLDYVASWKLPKK